MSAAIDELLISVPFATVNETRTSPRYYWDNARRADGQFVILQWTLEGTGAFSFEDRSWPLSAGDVFIAILPEESSYYFPKEATEPWRFAWVNFYGPLGIALARKFREIHGPVVPLALHSVAGEMFLSIAEKVETRALADRYELSADCYTFLTEWTRQLMRPPNQPSDRVELAISICKSRFREPLGIKELAAATGLTREHLTRLFTERTGISPGRYLRNLRIEAARQMLRSSDVLLREAALRCGFASVRALSKALAGAG